MSTPAPRPRPLGGFNAGFGDFNEHLDESAMQQAVQQKQLGQQATQSTQHTTGGSALQPGQLPTAPPSGDHDQVPTAPPPKPREVGTLTQELVTRPLQDIKAAVTSFFDINQLLGINPEQDDEQTQARKKQTLSRWQNLNEEQQSYAKQLYQEKMQRKQQEEQERQAKQQAEEQRKADTLVMPSSPHKGPIGPGGAGKSGKQSAIEKLQQDRQTLGGPASVN